MIMNTDSIFNFGDLSRDLAWLYADGRISCDDYLTLWEEIARRHVRSTQSAK